MVTVKMEMTYRKPVPLEQPLKITARIDELRGRRISTTGQVLLPDGTVAVEAHGLYLRIPDEQKESLTATLLAQGVDVDKFTS